ncbi:cell wall hydrolase [Cohnella sp. AR92]|uniref:cell wall hydrolase n=1 Tax=Cohnella sp. AR92 TaxID=648716 RepID=UPI000F8ED579|nr:cell wall hydrolase [Cohnella sp. AR92]RUS45742.1 LysM peptidoglycan-binding domain-containing protein [Cohnella sp. AR92]
MTDINRFYRLAVLSLALLLAVGTGSAFAATNSTLYIEDQKVSLDQSLRLIDGVTYAPVKELASLMDWHVAYDSGSNYVVVMNDIGDKLAFRTGESEIRYNGKAYDIAQTADLIDGASYLPLRVLTEAMHAKIGWQADEKASIILQQDVYTVQSGDTLASIAEANGTTVAALKARNPLIGAALNAGDTLKVITPEFMDPATADVALLAKLIQVEAGYESYEGKLAIANVVLNRVKSGKFPDTVSGVIYAAGQFPPARNGNLQTLSASSECVQAAKEALAGENNVPGALYFFNPKLEPNKAKTASLVKKIGNHMFVR